MIRTALLVAHTHWDREWYRTYQQFRLQLVQTVDQILETLDRDPNFPSFLLDAQTITLHDYLEMRPEREPSLRSYIASGRLLVGPWYCHPDTFLVSGEAIVRNLALGLEIAEAFGRTTRVGYIPDQFGHIGQLPQILAGFEIGSAVLWRGVNAAITRNESWWDAPNGSRVFLALLAQSYSNAQMLPLAPPALAARLQQLCDLLVVGATGQEVLLMNGGDHLPIQPGLPAAIERANALLADDWRVEIVALDAAIERLERDGVPRQVTTGELRSSATAHLLPGVLSTRMPLKIRNHRAQLLIERDVEPYAAWASLFGDAYPAGEIAQAWRYLLQNHPHDSICGCAIDAVPQEMETRFNWVEQIGEDLVQRSLSHLTSRIDTMRPTHLSAESVPIIIFNPGPETTASRVAAEFELPGLITEYDVVTAEGVPIPHEWRSGGMGEPSTLMPIPRDTIPAPDVIMAQFVDNRIMGLGVQHIDAAREEGAVHIKVIIGETAALTRAEIENAVARVAAQIVETDPLPVTLHIERNARHALICRPPTMPAHGYTTLWLRHRRESIIGQREEQREDETVRDEMTNGLLHVRVEHETGSYSLTNLRDGTTYGPCGLLIDGGDAGDSYTFAAPRRDRVVERPEEPVTVIYRRDALGASLVISAVHLLPARLCPERDGRSESLVRLPSTTTLRLDDESPRLDVTTSLVNEADDHRLRVTFAAPFEVDHVHASGAFEIVRRTIGAEEVDRTLSDAPLEDPVPEAPHQGTVLLHDDARALVVATRGLPEYSVTESGKRSSTLSVTLLRCIGWLSRDDVPTRRGGAGPALEIPEAQCHGEHSFSYALIPTTADWHKGLVEAERWQSTPRALTTTPHRGPLRSTGSFLDIDAPEIAVSAVKRETRGTDVILRIYNRSDHPRSATLTVLQSLTRVDLLTLEEKIVAPLYDGPATHRVRLTLEAHEIQTLRLHPEQGSN